MYEPEQTELAALLKDWAEQHRPATEAEVHLATLLAAVLSGVATIDADAPLHRLVEEHARLRRIDKD